MITGKTEEAVEAVASASTLIADTTVGARGRLSVVAAGWDGSLPCDGASNVALCQVGVCNFEEWLSTSCSTFGPRNEGQQLLLSGVVTVGEKDRNFWRSNCFLVDINLHLWDREVGEGLQSILDGVGILVTTQVFGINLDGTSVVLATELVDETQLEEGFLHTSALESASQFLEILAAVSVTVGLRVVASRALAERAVVTFVAGVAMALLVFKPWPVNTPGLTACCLGIRGNLVAEMSFRGLAEEVERVGIGTALSVSTAVIRARGPAATFTSEGREAFAFTSGAVTQTASATLAVCVLVVKSCVLYALNLFASWG